MSYDLGAYSFQNNEKLFTDIIAVDMILGEGFSRGDLIELAGESGGGKSTTALHMSANLCEKGLNVIYIDAERGLKEDIIKNMGLVAFLGKLFHPCNCTTYKELEDIMAKTLYSEKPPDVIIIDSITGIIPSKMLDTSAEDIEPGLESRTLSAFLKRTKPGLKERGCTVFLINQLRTKIDFKKGSSTISSGGFALQYFCDIRLQITPGARMIRMEKTSMGEKEIVFGNTARIGAVKNRSERSHIYIPLPVLYGRGVSNKLTIKELLTANKLITGGAGGHFTIVDIFSEDKKLRGTEALMKFISDNQKKILTYLKDKDLLTLTSRE